MKLKCPKCKAQYEIPDVAIPDAGRDVQCANCNETWFQVPPGGRAKPAEDAPAPAAKSPDTPPPATKSPDHPDHSVSDAKPSDPKPSGAAVTGDTSLADVPPRRELSPAVTDILRQEAAREEEARALKEKESKASSSKRRGRERLPEVPDIDVSNPRLNPTPAVEEEAEFVFDVDINPPDIVRKTGFKRGFSLIIMLMGMALLLYILAPDLAQKYPSLLEPLQAYVNFVNSGRIWLNDMFPGLIKNL